MSVIRVSDDIRDKLRNLDTKSKAELRKQFNDAIKLYVSALNALTLAPNHPKSQRAGTESRQSHSLTETEYRHWKEVSAAIMPELTEKLNKYFGSK